MYIRKNKNVVKNVDGAKLTPKSTLIGGVKLKQLLNLSPVSQFHLQMGVKNSTYISLRC